MVKVMNLKFKNRLNRKKFMLIAIVLLMLFITACTLEIPMGSNVQTQEKTTRGPLAIPEKTYIAASSDEDGWRDYYFASNT